MIQSMQQDLFGEAPAERSQQANLFAEIVFDRPLDHAYTYAVPERAFGARCCRQAGLGALRKRREADDRLLRASHPDATVSLGKGDSPGHG